MTLIDPNTGKPVKRSTGWCGINTIYRSSDKLGSPYMTRAWIGRLRLHIFHRGDEDPDPHDHPWPFWTFPLTSYVEEVTTPDTNGLTYMEALFCGAKLYNRHTQVVPAFRLTFRPASHTHRVLGRYVGFRHTAIPDHVMPYSADLANGFVEHGRGRLETDDRKIITIVWRGKEERNWGFLKYRDGRWCWQHWKDYIVNGGKNGPCQ